MSRRRAATAPPVVHNDESELVDPEPAVLTRNTSWINYSRGVWPMYLLLVGLFRFLVYFFFRLRAPLAWTLTVQLHAVCTFMSFHWNKGLPYADLIQSDVAGLTAWEQLSRAPSTFKARSFLTIAPVLLYIIAVTTNLDREAGGNDTFLVFNTLATAVVVVAKLDFMYGVRIFGINEH